MDYSAQNDTTNPNYLY